MDVVVRGLEDDVGTPLLPQPYEQLENVLPALGKRAHVEVVNRELRLWDAELSRRLAHLAGERVGREPRGQRAGRDRERDVTHLTASLDETRHRAAAAELAVVRVRRRTSARCHASIKPGPSVELPGPMLRRSAGA